MDQASSVLSHFWWVIPIVLMAVLYRQILRLFGLVMIPEDSLGIVNKRFVLTGSKKTLPDGQIIALAGEAGVQADTLAPGMHWGFWPWQYTINIQKFVDVPQGMVGVVESRDGKPISAGRVLGRNVDCDSFQNARKFLQNEGQRGPQITVIPPGTYRINTELFTVKMEPATEIPDNMVGIITTKDGESLPTGEIAGKQITGHQSFQDGQAFIEAKGFRGLQEEVILAGRYNLNPRFVTVEIKPMTEVPIANVGVVIAFVGDAGKDVSGEKFKHGNLVEKGKKGVWSEPLDPGKYAINPYTHKVEPVPTANVVLNWATGKTEAHKLDEKLSTIKVRSADGFTFSLDVSQIIHIPRNDAPLVIARFGTMTNLVTQVLEPTIGNYFRNASQKHDVIAFLKDRSDRQKEAKDAIAAALADFNVGAQDTLIGDIVPPEELMKTQTDRKLAEQQQATYAIQEQAQTSRQKLAEATALADTQNEVVAAQRRVTIAEQDAQAAVKKAEGEGNALKAKAAGEAESKKTQADADAHVLTVVGKAEGEKITAIGEAEAKVIEKKTGAMGQGNYAGIEIARALAAGHVKLVPDIAIGGSGQDGSPANALMALMLRGELLKQPAPAAAAPKA